jgi:hypothetical protein
MPYAPVDINSIKLDAPPSGFAPVDISSIKLDPTPEETQKLFADLEQKNGLPSGLLDSVWKQESDRSQNKKAFVENKAGAMGPFQFLAGTAEQYGLKDRNDLTASATAAAKMLGDAYKHYNGDLPSTLASYNWGSGNLARYGLNSAPKETTDYIDKVTSRLPSRPETPVENFLRQPKMALRMIAEGGGQIVDLPRNLINLGNFAYGKMGLPESARPQAPDWLPDITPTVSENLTQMGVPQPQNTVERLNNAAGSAATGGSMFGPVGVVTGAVGGASSQGAKEAGLGPGAQMAAGILGGGLAGLKSIGGKIPSSALTNLTAQDMRTVAGQAYKLAEAQGGLLTPDFTNKFLDEIQNIKPQTAAGKIIGGDDPVTQLVDKFSGIKDKTLTLDEAQELDELLGDKIDGLTENGRLTKQGQKVYQIQTTLRNMISDAQPGDIVGSSAGFDALQTGRTLWAAQARMRDIEKIITRAELTDNPASAVKTGFKNLLTNDARMRGFSADERALIQRAAQTGDMTDVLRTFGSRLNPIASMAVSNPIKTAATYVSSTALRNAASRTQLSRANAVNQAVAQNAIEKAGPLGQQLVKYLGTNKAQQVIAAMKARKALPYDQIKKLPPAVAMQLIGASQQ